MKFSYVIYKLTFPNGKIYIGKDIGSTGHSLRYFGSWNTEIVENDFTKEELSDFILRKEIIFESNDKKEVSKMEGEFIRSLRSNDPMIGYNRSHMLKK
ncbi:GIY-YIG nuclease family protein [Undibacterium sp. Ji67W]|uniref:GIY-YIG nuclease family protein n=1 Tax=Undibacterium sp. Ji67W TaxID=3413042 RepID=UPI003BF019ED